MHGAMMGGMEGSYEMLSQLWLGGRGEGCDGSSTVHEDIRGGKLLVMLRERMASATLDSKTVCSINDPRCLALCSPMSPPLIVTATTPTPPPHPEPSVNMHSPPAAFISFVTVAFMGMMCTALFQHRQKNSFSTTFSCIKNKFFLPPWDGLTSQQFFRTLLPMKDSVFLERAPDCCYFGAGFAPNQSISYLCFFLAY